MGPAKEIWLLLLLLLNKVQSHLTFTDKNFGEDITRGTPSGFKLVPQLSCPLAQRVAFHLDPFSHTEDTLFLTICVTLAGIWGRPRVSCVGRLLSGRAETTERRAER